MEDVIKISGVNVLLSLYMLNCPNNIIARIILLSPALFPYEMMLAVQERKPFFTNNVLPWCLRAPRYIRDNFEFFVRPVVLADPLGDVPDVISAEIPAEIPAEILAEIPAEIPAEVNIDAPASFVNAVV